MAQRAPRLKQVLAASRRTADQAQKSYLRSEDALSALEEREARRDVRVQAEQDEIRQRLPSIGGGH